MTKSKEDMTERITSDPIRDATHLRTRIEVGLTEHFAPTDPSPGLDVARHPRLASMLRARKFQFLLILPNQIIFWVVIFTGVLGTVVPGLNFATAITWYVWFALVFVMMVVVGRGWCAMCPFGGFAEWIQRATFWQRTQRRLGLGIKMPDVIARYGFLLSVGTFLLLTWIEEFFNIAGPGNPISTSYMVLGIVGSALLFFLVFERRTFCRYVCPLSSLIGTVGSMGSVAGFRTRDREVCLTCETKDCMRGGEHGYGCPWFTWPGSADSNLSCGLCTECYKACPSNNVGLFLQKPLTSVVAPTRRRADIAWAVAILWGLIIFQQFNSLAVYATIDGYLNKLMSFPQYPNPVDYVGIIGGVALVTAGLAWLISRTLVVPSKVQVSSGRSFLDKTSQFRAVFLPLMYGIIPVVGADYFARQLPKFFQHATRVIPAVGSMFGAGSTRSTLYNTTLLSNPAIIAVQVAVVGIGMLAAVWTSWKIASRELAPLSAHPVLIRLAAAALAVVFGVIAGVMYVFMSAAD